RGGHRRAERDGDADRGGRALRPVAAAPAARAGGPRRALLALHPVRRPGPAAPRGDRERARRLPARRDRPAAARGGGGARHAPARPAGVQGRPAPRGRRPSRAGARPRRPDHGRGPAPRAARARTDARGRGGPLRLRARPDPGMTEQSRIVRILDHGYSIIRREGRLEDGLRGLDEDFEWEAADYLDEGVRRGPDSVIRFFREWLDVWDDL